MTWRPNLLAVAALTASLGCDGSSAGSGPAGGPAVSGTVWYAGKHQGPLEISVFGSFPPRGAPIASLRIDAPRFPQAYAIPAVPPGRWFVLALVDTDPGDGAVFHPTVDPGGALGGFLSPTALAVDPAVGASRVEVELVDPSLASQWARGRYR